MQDEQGFFPSATTEAPAAPEKEVGFVPEFTAPVAQRVPENVDEIAIQASMATDSEQVPNLVRDNIAIRSQGMGGVLKTVLEQEHDDKIAGLKQLADSFLKAADPQGLKAAAEARVQLERDGVPPVEGNGLHANQLLTYRALEKLAYQKVRAESGDLGALDRQLHVTGGEVAARNILLQTASDKEDKASVLNKISAFFRTMVPFMESKITVDAINKTIGSDASMFDKHDAIVKMRNFLLAIPSDEERNDIVKRLVGELSSNPDVAATALRDIATISRSQAEFERGMDIVGLSIITDIAALYRGLASVARRGLPISAVKEVGGETAAGKLAAGELLGGTVVSGMTKEELFGRALANGVSPGEIEPALVKGINAATQAEMKQRWDTMLKSVAERLEASTMSAEEKAIERSRIMANYMPESNKNVYHVIHGEGSDTGQKMTVFWQGNNGKAFASEKAALKWAEENGLSDFKVVPKNTVDIPTIQPQTSFHGGSVTTEIHPGFEGTGQGGTSIGSGFYVSTAEHLAEKYAAKYGHTVSKWDIPTNSKFLNWYAKGADQPAVVQNAIAKLLGKDALKAEEGMDLYRAVVNKFGSEKAAGDALRKEGVVGNWASKSGPHGTGPEHVLFDAKDAKYKAHRAYSKAADNVVEEAPIEINGEIFYSQALGGGSGDPLVALKKSLAGGKTPLSRGEPLFTKGQTVEFGDTITPKMRRVMEDWVKLFRLEGKMKLLVLTEKDLAALELNTGLGKTGASYLKGHMELKNPNGFMTTITSDGTHLIVLNSKLTSEWKQQITTLSHELGHVFDQEILQRTPQAMRDALHKEFVSWMRKNGQPDVNAIDFRTLFRTPTEHGVGLAAKPRNPMYTLGNTTGHDWYGKFSEFWAENFSKFTLTNAKPVSVVEKWFYDRAQELKAFFVQVAKDWGFDSSKPAKGIDKLLRDYLANPTKWDDLLAQGVRSGKVDQFVTSVPSRTAPAAAAKAATTTTTTTGAGKTQWVVQQNVHDPLSYAGVGKYSAKDIGSSPWIAIDPKHGASELAVEARVIGVHAEAKVQKALVDFISPYWRGLDKNGRARVKSLLEEGDSFSNAGTVGKEFSYTEALSKGLSDKEAVAYLATRQLRMAMYHIRNGEMTKHLRMMGMKEVEFLGTSVKTIGKQVEMTTGSVYDTVGKTMIDLSVTPLPANQRIIRFSQPTMVDGELRSVVAINGKTASVREITTALHYRPGEYSRIYSDEYFIKMTRQAKVDGVMQRVDETIRTAMSAREAGEYTKGFTAAVALMRSGKNTDDALEQLIGKYVKVDEFKAAYDAKQFEGVTSFDFHYTRNKDEYLNGSVSEALANGRLFTSKRQDRLFSVDANRPNTLGVFESLEAEITSVSRVASVTQWRETNVRRWMNTFGDMIPNRTGDDVADFFSAAGAKFSGGEGKDAQFAERTHAYIMRQIGLRTNEEQAYQHMTRRMTEHMFTGNEKIETIGQKIRTMGVLGALRNLNFNLTLGMFNPAQLIVQANGAATAMILSPLHGLAAAKTFPLLRMALMSDNPDVWKFYANADKLSSLGLSKAEEFVDLVKAVRQTGIIDNIKSTALYNREDGRLNIFNSYPARLTGSHTFFFNRGEEFSRLVSFDVARREFMAANKEIAWNSKEGLAQIVVRMDDFTQNMTKANLARFQEGALSIPLQFAQYNIKLGMNVMTSLLGKGEGRGFTKGEAIKLMAGHLVLYGAAGNGLSWLLDEIVPKNTKETMTVEQKNYIAQGLISGLVGSFGEALTGERTAVALGTRLGSFDYYQKLAEAVFKDPKNIYEVALGPTLSNVKRIGVVGEVARLWARDPDLTGRDILEGLGKITTEQSSTLRNAAKAYLYTQHQDKLINGKGVTVAQLTTPEVLAQALGFQPTVAVDVSNLIKSKKDHTAAMEDIAGLIFKVQKDIMTSRMRGDHAYADEQHKLLTALWPTNAGDLWEVQKMVRDRLFPYDSDMQKLLGEYIWKGQTYNQPAVVTQEPRKE